MYCLSSQEISRYIDGLLTQAEQQQAEQHFYRCTHCMKLLEDQLICG